MGKDKPILAGFIAKHCQYLLKGDKKDFGALYRQEISGITIVDYMFSSML